MTDLSSDPLWTPGLSSRLRSKLRYFDPASVTTCTLRGLSTEIIPRAVTEDYIIADTTLIDGTIQRVIVHRDNVIWPKVEREPKPKKSPSQSKEVARLVKALKRFDPQRLAALLGQVDTSPPSEENIPF